MFRDSKDFVDGVDDAVSGVLVQFLQRTIFKLDARSCENCSNQAEVDLDSGGMVSLSDDVVLLLVLLRVDRRSGEGFVRVPDQTQRVYSSFHLVEGTYLTNNIRKLKMKILTRCLLTICVASFFPSVFPASLSKASSIGANRVKGPSGVKMVSKISMAV